MKSSRTAKTVLFLFFTLLMTPSFAVEPFKPLFNGKDFYGWEQKGGNAKYVIENGEIVGTSVTGTPNSFMCTKQHYSDFILELEFKVDPKLNSGIQIRSNSFPEFYDGRVHGYQIEIDPSDRAWSAGIYDEGRRGWVHPLEDNPKAQKAFKQNEWNHYRIEAIGDTFKTWINGVPAAHLYDTMTQSGFIALQVHSVGKDKDGLQVRWKNIRIIDKSPASYTKATPLPLHSMDNKLGDVEKRQGWKYLFDGKTSTGWRGARLDDFPKGGWVIEDGVLTILASGGGEAERWGDIVTIDKYSDFELQLDFKVSAGANSGIKYFVDPEINKGPGSSIGLEYQILDDERHPDAKLGNHEGSRAVTCLYDLIKSENKYPHAVGQWNHAHIISKGNHVEHWLNGRKALEYERKTPEFRQLVQESKYKKWPGFGEWDHGHILLQDHGDHVSFRNIKILVPKKKEKPIAFNPKLGVCTSIKNADKLKAAGFDYIEEGVRRFLVPQDEEGKFLSALETMQDGPMKAYSYNSFLPASFKSTGPKAVHDEILKFAETAFRRAKQADSKIIVFGSGGSRKVPDGFSHEKACEQFVDLLKRMGPIAEKYGIVVVLEPLNKGETNFINSVKEGTAIARDVNHSNIKVLADFYHMAKENEGPQSIIDAGPLLVHCHIAELEGRAAPGTHKDDFTGYLKALKQIGYTGRISVECRWKDFDNQLAPAIAYLKDQIRKCQ